MTASKNKGAQSKTPPVSTLKLQIDSEVTRSIRQHARSFMQTEVCGVLIGEERKGLLEIEASIQASSAAQAGTHVTFTQDAWEEIYKVKDESYPDHRIVGWYHSHPGFGVFLSEHDTFIHRNFFSSPNQVAWVYDPHTDEEGCFGWVEGEIHRIPELSIIDLRGDGEERTPHAGAYNNQESSTNIDELLATQTPRRPPPTYTRAKQPLTQLAMNIAGFMLAAILGFAICFFLFPSYVGIAMNPYTMEPMMVSGKPVIVSPPQSLRSMDPAGILQEPLKTTPGLPPGVGAPATSTPAATTPSATQPPAPAKQTPKPGDNR